VPNVLVVRGHLATPWELAPWAELPERYRVSYLLTRSNGFDVAGVQLPARRVAARRDRLPRGAVGDAIALLTGDRYTGDDADAAFADAGIVHAEELSFWFAADAARRKQRSGFKLVQTVWETLPLLGTYRNRQARLNRQLVLAHTDLYLAATERARLALLIEGVPERRIVVCPPGIDLERFSGAPAAEVSEHTILSPGRLVWDKGHQDVLRAVKLLARDGLRPRVRIVGRGPEEARLRAYATELGLADRVTIESQPYGAMPSVFAAASAMVLASLPSAGGGVPPLLQPRVFWEEQFGLVLAEAMASGVDIIASDSGAIASVLEGSGTLIAPGDWPALAEALRGGALARPPAQRVTYPAHLLERYSTSAMAGRLAAAYDRLEGGDDA
jgi:glycosyltransferase involved in cell wall biosynthesis